MKNAWIAMWLAGTAWGGTVTPVQIPGGEHGVGFDDLMFSPGIHRMILPAALTGNLFLADPATLHLEPVAGFSTTPRQGGRGGGTTSADEGPGMIFATDRTTRTVNVVDEAARKIVASVTLSGGPDYVRWVGPTSEVWVTEPHDDLIEVFSFTMAGGVPRLTHTGEISVTGGVESLVIDGVRGRAYTNLEDDGGTLALDLASRKVVAAWPSGATPRGLALDAAHGLLFVGCGDGRAVSLDVTKPGVVLDTLQAAPGIDIVSYDSHLAHLYLPGAEQGTLVIASVSSAGKLAKLGAVKTAKRCRAVAADGTGQAWVPDPAAGRVLVIKDPYPAKAH